MSLPQSFVQRKVGRFAPPQALQLCNTVCTSADAPCRHLTEQQVFLPQCIHHPLGILWRHSGCRILITVQCYSPAASGNLAYHALTERGCERQVKGTSGAAGAVGAPRGCQAPAGQKPASASELSEAGSCRLGRSRQLTASANFRQWTAEQFRIACRLWQADSTCRLQRVWQVTATLPCRQATARAAEHPCSGRRGTKECSGSLLRLLSLAATLLLVFSALLLLPSLTETAARAMTARAMAAAPNCNALLGTELPKMKLSAGH